MTERVKRIEWLHRNQATNKNLELHLHGVFASNYGYALKVTPIVVHD